MDLNCPIIYMSQFLPFLWTKTYDILESPFLCISMFAPLTEVCQDRLTIDITANLFQQNNWPNSIWKVFNHIWRNYINCVVFCMDLLCLFMNWLRLLLVDCKVNRFHILGDNSYLAKTISSCGSQNTPIDTYFITLILKFKELPCFTGGQ